MPKLRKEDVADIDVNELEDAEYSEGTFVSYSGDIPPNDTVLTGYVKSMWWTRTQEKQDGSGNKPMLVVLWIAEENEGDLEQYNGLPCWERLALTSPAKFKWAPFFEQFGLTVQDVKVGKTGTSRVVVAADDDNIGAPIEKIGNFTPGSDESWCRIVTVKESYDGKPQAHVRTWLDYEDEEGDEADDEPDEDEVDDEAEEEDEDEEAEEEAEEEEAAPPARGRRTAAKASKTPAATPTRPAARKAAPSRSAPAKPTAAKAPARGKGRRAAGSSDDPPF